MFYHCYFSFSRKSSPELSGLFLFLLLLNCQGSFFSPPVFAGNSHLLYSSDNFCQVLFPKVMKSHDIFFYRGERTVPRNPECRGSSLRSGLVPLLYLSSYREGIISPPPHGRFVPSQTFFSQSQQKTLTTDNFDT